jgi:hypothetical protein
MKCKTVNILQPMQSPPPAPPPNTQESESEPLTISVWQTYPNHAVLDWFITLAEKDTLVRCDMAYAATEDEDDDEDTKVVENFLPPHRTFGLSSLSSNTSYCVCVRCRDKAGSWRCEVEADMQKMCNVPAI